MIFYHFLVKKKIYIYIYIYIYDDSSINDDKLYTQTLLINVDKISNLGAAKSCNPRNKFTLYLKIYILYFYQKMMANFTPKPFLQMLIKYQI